MLLHARRSEAARVEAEHEDGEHEGVVMGVRTELEVKGAKDKGDLDQPTVSPLPAQEAVLEAFGQLGFGFKSADLELGHIGGTGQTLPLYQADKRGGLFSGGHDALNRFTVSHDGVEHRDWNAEVDAWVRQLVDSHASHGRHGAPYGQGYAHHDGYGGYGGYDMTV